jgi:uncharacterized caspase-like protein
MRLALRFLATIVGVIASALLATAGMAEKRVALVVGNAAYLNVSRLDNPANDANAIAATLTDLGFSVIGGEAQLDLDKAGLDRAVQAFGRALQGADVGLFYYAGHGVQIRGTNYLVPVDANPTREADVDFQMLDSNVVLRQMESAGTRLNLVILDACRNNPLGGRGFRDGTGGLAQMRAPEGTLISFATQPGNVAQDGADGHSPFTRALAATMRQPGLDLFNTFNEVGLAVRQATAGAQQPWVSSSPIAGHFYFAAPPAPAAQAADEIAWNALSTTTDAAALRRFVAEYPASGHRPEAIARIAALESQGTAPDSAAAEIPRPVPAAPKALPGVLPPSPPPVAEPRPAYQEALIGRWNVVAKCALLSDFRMIYAFTQVAGERFSGDIIADAYGNVGPMLDPRIDGGGISFRRRLKDGTVQAWRATLTPSADGRFRLEGSVKDPRWPTCSWTGVKIEGDAPRSVQAGRRKERSKDE